MSITEETRKLEQAIDKQHAVTPVTEVISAKKIKEIGKEAVQNYQNLRQPNQIKKILKERIHDVKTLDLLNKGLVFAEHGASAQEVLEIYSPVMMEMLQDFIFENMHNELDPKARDLAHKHMGEIMKSHLSRTDKEHEKELEDGDADDAKKLEQLTDVLDKLSEKGLTLEDFIENGEVLNKKNRVN